ncbi:hypothetical protein A2619_02610 [candidate division WWE3 bacterium RIFOXYD1_FULL_39_9]|uniref:Uncharacterized protein n=1 Tax=candidate division WWE3 bacterium RIFOXYD1_FULL_39_9 TaxID=1802649 RepID=A0A1F4X9K6_UNCKA|nr:MAG: hypothetical protein A2619_02610 [candidate division WWE3 bacterium RIFOXYD1_FULL_39_9]
MCLDVRYTTYEIELSEQGAKHSGQVMIRLFECGEVARVENTVTLKAGNIYRAQDVLTELFFEGYFVSWNKTEPSVLKDPA